MNDNRWLFRTMLNALYRYYLNASGHWQGGDSLWGASTNKLRSKSHDPLITESCNFDFSLHACRFRKIKSKLSPTSCWWLLISSQDNCRENLTVVNPRHATRRIWTCAEPEFRLWWWSFAVVWLHHGVQLVSCKGDSNDTRRKTCFSLWFTTLNKWVNSSRGFNPLDTAIFKTRIRRMQTRIRSMWRARRFWQTQQISWMLRTGRIRRIRQIQQIQWIRRIA